MEIDHTLLDGAQATLGEGSSSAERAAILALGFASLEVRPFRSGSVSTPVSIPVASK